MFKKIAFSVLALSTSLIAAGSEEQSGATPVMLAKVDKLGDHQYECYREPVAVKTNSGRLIVGVHAGNRLKWPERSGQDLVIRYSDDQGKTWSPLIVAAEHKDFSVQSHGLVYDAQKNRLQFLYVTYNWNYNSIKGKGAKATGPVYLKMHAEGKPFINAYTVHSDDDGKTWSTPRDITDMVGGNSHFGASEGRQLTVGKHAGRLILAGGDERNMSSNGKVTGKKSGSWYSDDHGVTWTFSQVKTSETSSCEARVSELPDGTLIYNGRLKNSKKGRLISFSKDGGTTWAEGVTVKQIVTAKSNGCTVTLRDESGKLTSTLLCSVPRGGGMKKGTIYISKDGGKTWPQSKLIVPKGYFKYSAMVQLDAEHIGFIYETNHYKDIFFKKLALSDLLK